MSHQTELHVARRRLSLLRLGLTRMEAKVESRKTEIEEALAEVIRLEAAESETRAQYIGKRP